MGKGDVTDKTEEAAVETKPTKEFLAFRTHNGEFLGPFPTFEAAAAGCQGQGPCFIFAGAFNAAWGE